MCRPHAKMCHTEMKFEILTWIPQAQDRVWCRDFSNIVMNDLLL